MKIAEPGTLHHTCFVVKDVNETAQSLAKSLGIQWGVWTIAPSVCRVHGKDSPFSFRVAIGQIGGSNYELISPHEGHSVYVEHLADKGEGFHHTCIAYSSMDDVRAARDELVKQGRDLIQSGGHEDLFEFYYFAIPETDSVLELLFLAELPPPEKTIE